MRESNGPTIGSRQTLTLDDVAAYAAGRVTPALSRAPEFERRIRENRAFLEQRIAASADIYGVTTGFGSSSRNTFSGTLARQLQHNLAQYHGCGVGALLSEEECAAT